jgi:putative ABC transport system permease protein
MIESSQTGDEYASLGLAPWRIAASVSGSLGIVGLLLAGIGVYGVTAYMVTRRTREIGVRIALGASRGSVVALIVKQGMWLVAIGGFIGMAFGAGAGQLLASLLFGAPPVDLLIFSATAGLFLVIGFLACYIPALRATRINAIEALRHD